MKQILLSTIVVIIAIQGIWAQKKLDGRSEKIYSAKGYGKYIELQGDDYAQMDKATIQKLALASRKTGDYRTAEKLYAALIEMGDTDPYNHLYYAQALQSNGRYLKAREHFKICDEKLQDKANGKAYDQRARLGYDACNRIAEMRALGKVSVENEIILNTGKYDFSPTYYKRGIVFVSTRNKLGGRKDRWLNDNFMDLYYAPLAAGNELDKPELFSKELNTDFHEGPAVFTKDQKQLFFTRNDFNKGKRGKAKDGTTKLKIYSAQYEGEAWGAVEELPFNNREYDVCHPALSPDGKMLVFASNMPGGQGGMDLWVSRFQKNDWQKPVNLGSKINTEGNEVFPFIHDDGTLFFSSNGLSTIGGLDIFMATQIFNHPDSLWEFPFNLGDPLNSSFDDFGIVMNKAKTEGFFSSSREGGAGGDDIYRFKIADGLDEIKPTPTMAIDVCVYNDDTRERIPDAELKIRRIAKSEEASKTYITNENGYTSCEMRAGEQYLIDIVRKGFYDVNETFIMPNTVEGLDEFCIGMVRDAKVEINEPLATAEVAARPTYDATPIAPINYEYNPEIKIEGPQIIGMIKNADYDKPLPRVNITLLNRCTGEELTMQAGEDGLYGFPLECGCEYVVKSSKNRFTTEKQVISLVNPENCGKPIELDLSMTPDFTIENALAEEEPVSPSSFTPNTVKNLKQGDVIELRNIYYDYNKWDIRRDAARDLNALVELMEKYPTMEIELSSHTDIRGSDSYNEKLSDKRAKSAVAYLAKQGVAQARMTARGFGESRPKNDCRFCTEDDHQENRRTEVRIVKLERK